MPEAEGGLADGGNDHDIAGDGLVGVTVYCKGMSADADGGVVVYEGTYGNSDGGDCNAYQSHEAEADDDDYLPRPSLLIAHSYDLRRKGKRSAYRISTREAKRIVFPTKQAAIYGNKAGNLISGSLIPRFRFVPFMLTQSLSGPAVNSPIAAPPTNARFTSPTAEAVKS